MGVGDRILWVQGGVDDCDQGRKLEVLRVPFISLSRSNWGSYIAFRAQEGKDQCLWYGSTFAGG
jgi:hypothetical protein